MDYLCYCVSEEFFPTVLIKLSSFTRLAQHIILQDKLTLQAKLGLSLLSKKLQPSPPVYRQRHLCLDLFRYFIEFTELQYLLMSVVLPQLHHLKGNSKIVEQKCFWIELICKFDDKSTMSVSKGESTI